MDPVFHEVLREGAKALCIPLDDGAISLLERFADRLLVWNRKVNLTSVTDAAELAEKHLVDSLALLRGPGIPRGSTLLDIGSGGGLPGIPLACARPDLRVTCCDAVGKKVSFLKLVSAELSLEVRALTVRVLGKPDEEGLARSATVVSRAQSEVAQWVPLGAAYVAEGGQLVAMLGKDADEEQLRGVGEAHGMALQAVDRFRLPVSGAQRAIARWRSA